MSEINIQTIQQIENQLQSIEDSYGHNMELIDKIRAEFNHCLQNESFSFSSVLNYYMDPHFYNTAESRRIFIIIHISQKEYAVYGKSLFLSNITNLYEALNNYVLITLAIRRVNLQLPSELVEQAKEYLLSIQLSPHAIVEIVSNELFEGIDWLLNELFTIMSAQWNKYEQIYYCSYVTELFPTEFNCIRTASLYLECNEPKLACKYLEKIDNPSSEISALISNLKGTNYEQE